jgi:2-C-methyl-D-erythritol 4-phosphate cytidylyltransferase
LPRDVGVIIVAAGQGARLGGAVPKQYRELAGVPMLLHALRPFPGHPEVAHTVIVLPQAEAATPPEWLAPRLGATVTVAAGGATRSDSVGHGLDRLPPACVTVLVHDAARPLVDRPTIDRVIAAARLGHAVVPGIPLEDTLKEATGADLIVERTVPRDHLWRVQTPQGFPRALLVRAHDHCRRTSGQATDDATLVEALGAAVRIVPGSAFNLKVTTEEDLRMAERLL